MKFKIARGQGDALRVREFDYEHDETKRPMALDVLLQAKATSESDLAFRYGCRNELCGVCTIEVNGQPRLACRCRVSEGDTLGPLTTLPHLRDLVVEREAVNKQLLNILEPSSPGRDLQPGDAIKSLNRCIECYACLSDCPMHLRNNGSNSDPDTGFEFGNPYSLLKLRRTLLEPQARIEKKTELLRHAVRLGLDSCLDCDGCKCQVGISLNAEVVEPLLAAASGSMPGF